MNESISLNEYLLYHANKAGRDGFEFLLLHRTGSVSHISNEEYAKQKYNRTKIKESNCAKVFRVISIPDNSNLLNICFSYEEYLMGEGINNAVR